MEMIPAFEFFFFFLKPDTLLAMEPNCLSRSHHHFMKDGMSRGGILQAFSVHEIFVTLNCLNLARPLHKLTRRLISGDSITRIHE